MKVATPTTATPGRQRVARKSESRAHQVTAEERLRFIEMAAYYIAEKRGFCGGNPSDDWVAAENQIDTLLLSGHLPA